MPRTGTDLLAEMSIRDAQAKAKIFIEAKDKRIAELEALLRRADAAVVWETVMPDGRKFQDEVEKALGIGQASNT